MMGTGDVAGPRTGRARGPLSEVGHMFLRNHSEVAALCVLVAVVIATVIGPSIYGVDPFDIVWGPFTRPGEGGFLLGTDYLGRDMLAGLLYGGRVSLVIGLSAALMSVCIGIAIGSLAGFYRGWVEEILMRFTEFFQVLPTLLFSMVIVALFGASIEVVTIAIGVAPGLVPDIGEVPDAAFFGVTMAFHESGHQDLAGKARIEFGLAKNTQLVPRADSEHAAAANRDMRGFGAIAVHGDQLACFENSCACHFPQISVQPEGLPRYARTEPGGTGQRRYQPIRYCPVRQAGCPDLRETWKAERTSLVGPVEGDEAYIVRIWLRRNSIPKRPAD